LPASWHVSGTTGYDFAALLNGLFICPESKGFLTRLYARFGQVSTDFEAVLYERKKLIIRSSLSSELTVLAASLKSIADADRHTRDFTYNSLRDALAEVVAYFPVYRSYLGRDHISEEDRRYVEWAVIQAKKHNPAIDNQIFDFIQNTLLMLGLEERPPDVQRFIMQFISRFQQYSAPVMAKGMEDTAFYVFNRLVSLNDVGFDPRNFGTSPAAFHHGNEERQKQWPHAMINTSTHDSKRSEDVRATISVLSEMPEEWRRHLGRWSRINRYKKRQLDGERAPSRNDEYLFYQTLVGSWPSRTLEGAEPDGYLSRIETYMLKAAREAKIATSWINPNTEYEEAMQDFVRALLRDSERNTFLADFVPFAQKVARFGTLNSLSQTLLKLTSPGVPDIYQGTELLTYHLVDPDNRRVVDYQLRQEFLQQLMEQSANDKQLPALLSELVTAREDGRAKLYITWKTLGLRRQLSELFRHGSYSGLAVEGEKAEHVCAFARLFGDDEVIVIAGRWFARLLDGADRQPLGESVWGQTVIVLPDQSGHVRYRNVLTNEQVAAVTGEHRTVLHSADVFNIFPLALLVKEKSD
jgi:(1->4)-alpha-D-glucan 1-alpha-D-glucosylmutase